MCGKCRPVHLDPSENIIEWRAWLCGIRGEEMKRSREQFAAEEKGWDGERGALSLSMQTLSESESLAQAGTRRGGQKKDGMEEVEADKWDGQEGIEDEERLGKYAERQRGQCIMLSCSSQHQNYWHLM